MSRFDISKLSSGASWQDEIAQQIIKNYPNEEIYTVAAGISPSGPIHFGNFRDVMTSYLVQKALEGQGKKTQFIFSFDNYDRFRKVPEGIDASFEKEIGKPLALVQDPDGEDSYATHFMKPFEEAMKELSIDLVYRNQYDMYASGVFDEHVKKALQNREKIAEILLSFMTEKAKKSKDINEREYKKDFYPVSLYSRFTGKDSTKILSYDGEYQITYYCAETKQEDTIDFTRDRFVKLNWKVDWPMRWAFDKVLFEPGGSDHAGPGGSYDVSSVISKEVFGFDPPAFVEYGFVGIQGMGTKMSGSVGNAITPKQLLEIYEPDVLKWLYSRKLPKQTFQLAFDTEIYRQYDEYDKENGVDALSFRQTVGLGQIVQWSEEKLDSIAKNLNVSYRKERLIRAKQWVEKYNQDAIIVLRDEVNTDYVKSLSDNQKKNIETLKSKLIELPNASVEEIELFVYDIPKENLGDQELKKAQREFFKDIYNLLISKDAGPRLGSFLWAADRDKILNLLNI